MRTLALLRHGKSSWQDPSLQDFDRALKPRGREAAKLMGRHLREQKIAFDLVLASPARRVVETIAHLQQTYGDLPEPRFEASSYGASPLELLRIVRECDAQPQSLLLAGHNPGLQGLALLLAADDDPHQERIASYYPTAAFVLLKVEVAEWQDLQPGSAHILHFVTPKDLLGSGGR